MAGASGKAVTHLLLQQTCKSVQTLISAHFTTLDKIPSSSIPSRWPHLRSPRSEARSSGLCCCLHPCFSPQLQQVVGGLPGRELELLPLQSTSHWRRQWGRLHVALLWSSNWLLVCGYFYLFPAVLYWQAGWALNWSFGCTYGTMYEACCILLWLLYWLWHGLSHLGSVPCPPFSS